MMALFSGFDEIGCDGKLSEKMVVIGKIRHGESGNIHVQFLDGLGSFLLGDVLLFD